MNTRSIARFGLLTAMALMLGYFERFIPIAPGIPGIKLGLANIVTLFALYNLEKLLGNINAGEVFLRSNVSLIRRVCRCCLLVSAICLPAAFYYPPLIFFCIVMAFLCPVVNVVRRVFDAAVTIREENDLTI